MIWNHTEPPKNGGLLLLLVRSNEENDPTEDEDVFRTIGFNNGNPDEDEWQCAGWDWCGDEFTRFAATASEIIGWMEFPEIPEQLEELFGGGNRRE